MADNERVDKIKIRAEADQAKADFNELSRLADETQRKIDRAFNAVNSNNNTISNRQLAGVQNNFGQLNDLKGSLQNDVNDARANMAPNEANQLESQISPKLDMISQLLQQLASQNTGKLSAINGANTTSSRAFHVSQTTDPNGNPVNWGRENINNQLAERELQKRVNNFESSLRREQANWNQTQQVGSVSYNRYQQYRSSANNASEQLTNLQGEFENPDSDYSRFQARYSQIQSQAANAEKVASGPDATSAQVKWARELNEQVKEMDKLNSKYQELEQRLSNSTSNVHDFNSQVGAANDKKSGLQIGYDPESLKGQLYRRRFSIARGMIAAGAAAFGALAHNGVSRRLNSFDDIKSIAYANGGQDNRTINTLGNYGYRWGYSGDQMAGFANAYTSSTGNVGSINDVARTANAWARQSRVTGATDQSTQALEQAAGNASSLSSSQMTRLGNDVTNEIINSGMGAKATQQQQGLAALYQNGTNYGMTASDERNMAGFQASMSKYGSQFQGTTGAQNTMALAQTLGNYNNPGMRQLFYMTNPGRYSGVDGNARMMEDMQNFNKQPWKMRSTLQNAQRAFGGDTLRAAAYISEQSGGSVSVDTAKKWIEAANNGSMSQSQFEKYVKKTKRSGKGANQLYDKTGASKLQKYNASLANSAIKASEALDKFAKVLSKINQSGGGLGGIFSSIISGAGGTLLGNVLSGLITGHGSLKDLSGLLKGKGGRSLRDILKGVKENGVKNTLKDLPGLMKGKGKSVWDSLKKAPSILRDLWHGKRGSRVARDVARDAEHGAEKAGGRGLFRRGLRFVGHHALDFLFAGNDLRKGHWLDAIDDFTPLGLLSGTKFNHKIERQFGDAGRWISKSMRNGHWLRNLREFRSKDMFHPLTNFFRSIYDKTGLTDYLEKKEHPEKYRAMHRAHGQSVKEARKTARKYNRREAERRAEHEAGHSEGFLKRVGRLARHHKGFLGAAALVGGGTLLGSLLDDNTAHASTRKRRNATAQSQDWKILRGYNKMLNHAMRVVQAAKSITSGDGKDKDSGGDIGDLGSGKGDKAIRKIAKAVAKKDNLDAKMVYAQLALESADGTSEEAQKDNNFAGIKGSGGGAATDDGGTYQHFNSISDFANEYAKILANDGLRKGMSVDEFAQQLKNKGYYTASESDYAAQLRTWVNKWAVGGIRTHATGQNVIANVPTRVGNSDLYGEAGTEAYTPLNPGHYNEGLANLKDLAGMFGKEVVNTSDLTGQRQTTINPSYNINLTINGGTDDANGLAQTVAAKVQDMLRQYDQQQQTTDQHNYFGNETSGLFV